MSNLKVGDFVRLTDKARKDFYQTDKYLETFDFPNFGEWRDHSFIKFVSDWLGFDSGDQAGGIVHITTESVWVKFFSPIYLNWQIRYYNVNDLIKVGSANE